jgi:F-type H+-transporting ATPase subunit gamma
MRRAITIRQELYQIHTVEDLTEIFESIASIRISKLRNRVVASKAFFAELWQTYSGLRIDPRQRLKRTERAKAGRDVFVAVTGEGSLSGEIDEQIVTTLMEAYGKVSTHTDVIVIGSHGQSQLRQRTIPVAKAFSMPTSDSNFSVTDIINSLTQYDRISVFYQTYESLRVQKVARIELIAAVQDLSEDVSDSNVEVVSSRDYIFEPSTDEIADYLESVMMGVALIQVIMESKLASYAARFNAMNSAKNRASDLVDEYDIQYHRAKRAEADERLKEIVKVVKHKQKRLA